LREGERRKGEGEGEEERRRAKRIEKRLRKCKAHLDDERSGYRWRRRGVVQCEVEEREERPAAGINIGNLMASGIHVL